MKVNERLKTTSENKINKIIPYALICLVAIVMLLPQIHTQSFISGMDYYFHMSRTYETAMQIKTGHFSYFLSIFSWHHNARIVNAIYGPFGGYVSGLILVIAKSWFRWEVTVFFITLVLAGGTMYHLGRYWNLKPVVNLLISVLYMLSAPVSNFIFLQVFAGFTAALVPLIVLMMSELLREKDINPIKLALVITLIIELHLMTFVLSMTFVIPCVLLGICVSKRRMRVIIHVFEAAVLTILLSVNEWGGVLEVFGSNRHHVIPTFPGRNIGMRSRSTILVPSAKTPFKASVLYIPSVIGLCGLLVIVIAIVMWLMYLRRLSYVIDFFMFLGILAIWMSSGWFPWRWMVHHFTTVSLLIQFPKRFLPIGLVLIYLTLGITLSKLSQSSWGRFRIGALVSIVLLAFLIGFTGVTNSGMLQAKIQAYHSSKVIDWLNMHRTAKRNPSRLRNSLVANNPGLFLHMVSNSVPDYLPTSVVYRGSYQYNKVIDPYVNYNRYYLQKMQRCHFHWWVPKHGVLNLTLNSKYNHMQTIPFAKYTHTQVTLNNRQINPTINRVGAMKVPLRAGQNRLSLQYRPSQIFEFGMLLSILTWIWLLLDWIYIKFGTKISII